MSTYEVSIHFIIESPDYCAIETAADIVELVLDSLPDRYSEVVAHSIKKLPHHAKKQSVTLKS